MFAAQRPQLGYRLNRADFIVSRHYGDEDGVCSQCFLQRIRPHDTFPVHWKHGKLEAFFLGQVFKRMENSMMFYSASDQVASFWLKEPRGSEEGQVYALGAAAGIYNNAWFAAQKGRSTVSRIIENGPGLPPDMMNTRRIAPNLAQVWQHRLPDLRVQGGSRVVIEINCPHHVKSKGSPAAAGSLRRNGLPSRDR